MRLDYLNCLPELVSEIEIDKQNPSKPFSLMAPARGIELAFIPGITEAIQLRTRKIPCKMREKRPDKEYRPFE